MTWADWVPLAIAFAGGTALTKIIDVIYDKAKGASERRRTEVDRMARQLKDAQRRERIATEHAHEVRVLALQAGVPSSKLPVLDFRDDPEGVMR